MTNPRSQHRGPWLSALLLAIASLAPGPASAQPAPPAASASSPLGLWRTVDDKTGQPRALVRIYLQDGKYFGRIERSFTPGAESRVCAVCTDARKNQPIIGLVIVRDMSPRDGEFEGGDILDPDSGSVYRCKFHLEKAGSELAVRGFIGISLLGRSQTWLRQE
ncbi:MAG TPA: DUF2147 domain-containing protein [Steroidobacteraceae bacterium]|jgi:uncharacterized protein (DUF2147 family)|nr:DUF2147 domain-containing protein [Steroidobacteraceae bacterium]